MYQVIRFGFFSLSLLACIGLIGCGSPGPEVTVTGKVTMDGSPLPDATIGFHPSGQQVSIMNATSGPDGTYTAALKGGAAFTEGEYVVTVEKWQSKSGAKVELNPEEGMDLEQLKMSGAAVNAAPAIYSKPSSSPLRAPLKKGEVTADLNLEAEGKAK